MDIVNHYKVTDPQYKLSIIEALEGIKIMSDGANKPLLIRGINKETGDKGEFIVKFNAAERMDEGARCYEFLGSCIAKELGLHPAESVIIEITQDFVDQSVGKDWWGMANKSVGYNYGCYYTPGGVDFVVGNSLTSSQRSEAQKIFAFDILISNPDRNNEKQNMVTDGENILIFDHELAFGFLFALFYNNKTPWIIDEKEEVWIKKHYFYPQLKGNTVEFAEFIDKLASIDDNFWDKIYEHIPEMWKVDNIIKIKNQIKSFVENREVFFTELKKIVE